MPAVVTAPSPPRPHRLVAWLHRVRTRLIVAQLALVVAPFVGLELARVFERELLLREEESLVMVAHGVSLAASRGEPVDAIATAAQRHLGAQVRVLDAGARPTFDSGPESLEKVTVGRTLVSSSTRAAPVQVTIDDPPPDGGSFAGRREIAAALSGRSGRATRVTSRVRAVRLFVAEPIVGPGGAVTGVAYVARTTYPVLVSLYRVRAGLVKLGAASALAALGSGLWLALTLTRPLARLTAAARRIAAGERGVQLRVEGHDEVAELARAFDVMSRRLDLRLAHASELAANVSHEFKTPLASIRGAAELLRDGAADEPEARARFLGNILADVARMGRLVTRLLELGRIEAGAEARADVEVATIVDEATSSTRARGRAVEIDLDPRAGTVWASGGELVSALSSLVENADRFARPGSAVGVRVSLRGERTRFEVRDDGAGISEDNLGRVFDRFFTTDRARGGTGLGLSIAKAMAEGHGGEVGVSSAPGDTRFWIELPGR